MSRRDPDVSRRLVMYLAMACHSNGADLRADGSSEELGKVYPRQEMDAGIWQRRTARQLIWDAPEHINRASSIFGSAAARLLTPTRQHGQHRCAFQAPLQ
eukprot:8509079-Pyramimonas_sp.AAC.1